MRVSRAVDLVWLPVGLLFLAVTLRAIGFPADPAPAPLLTWGTPSKDFVIKGKYAVSYNGAARCPNYSIEYLSPMTLKTKGDRTNVGFKSDPLIPKEFSPKPSEYAHTLYDLGHVANAADAPDQASLVATFTMLNVCAELHSMNRGAMLHLETHIRDLAKTPGTETWVVTLPIFNGGDGNLTITRFGESQIWVPRSVAKSVLQRTAAGTITIRSWLIPNAENLPHDVADFTISTDEVERLAGFDVFAGVPDGVEDAEEAKR